MHRHSPSFLEDKKEYIEKIDAILKYLIPKYAPLALFDFPNHPNVGDSAIWLGEIQYFKDPHFGKIIAVDDHRAIDWKLPVLPKKTVVLIHGGGNLGDLYPYHQKIREQVIGHYRDHRVIQLPQSIHFQDNINKDFCRKIMNSHNDFHLLVRDYQSLELAKDIHDGPSYLCPDMALCLEKLPSSASVQYPIVQLLRTDTEKVNKNELSFADHEVQHVIDWLDEPTSIAQWFSAKMGRLQAKYPRWTPWLNSLKPSLFHALATERLTRGCALLCSGEVVITDRLHGHIMCYLLGIPHVVLDNTYRKIGNFRDAWGTGNGLCVSANSHKDAYEKALILLEQSRISSTLSACNGK